QAAEILLNPADKSLWPDPPAASSQGFCDPGHNNSTAPLWFKLFYFVRLPLFPQFHSAHHNNKEQRPFQSTLFLLAFVDFVAVHGAAPVRLKMAGGHLATLAVSTDFHMLAALVKPFAGRKNRVKYAAAEYHLQISVARRDGLGDERKTNVCNRYRARGKPSDGIQRNQVSSPE